MPPKGENPITSYFPRATPNSKLKTPARTKPKSTKRARQADETDLDLGKESSRKKSKSRKGKDHEGSDYQSSLSTPSRTAVSLPHPSVKKLSGAVIEIEGTLANSPVKPASLRCTTPPSSPLPELTPSPENSRTCSPSHQSQGDIECEIEPGPSYHNSVEASYPEPQEVELELVPSSQTQTLDLPFYGGNARKPQALERIPTRNPESSIPFQSSSYIPSSQPGTLSPDFHTAPDEFVASSQTQLVDLIPTSPVDPDFGFVPSSQTQELFFPQASTSRAFDGTISTSSDCKVSSMDDYMDEPQVSSRPATRQSSVGGERTKSLDARAESVPDQDCHDDHYLVIPSSQTLACASRPSSPCTQDEEPPVLSQLSENRWDDGSDSYESLPDAVKEFSEMFGGTYESYPPDFPSSLR